MREDSASRSRANHDQATAKTRSSRATKACLSCRSRKVRCDVLTRAPNTCTNCSLDGLKCDLAPRAKPRTRQIGNRSHWSSSFSRRTAIPVSGLGLLAQTESIIGQGGQGIASPNVGAAEPNRRSLHPLSGYTERPISLSNRNPDLGITETNASPNALGIAEDPVFDPNAHVSASSTTLVPQDDDTMFADLHNTFPDADILEQYWNNTIALDSSLFDFLDVDSSQRAATGTAFSAGHDAFVFRSPLNWIADWAVEDNNRSRNYAEAVEQRAFNLPSPSEINRLVQLYISHAHHRLPVLNARNLHDLITGTQEEELAASSKPISLALLYAIMFFACAYLRTENSDPSYVQTIRSMRCEYHSRAALLFKLGNETDPLRQAQVCLLLSTYRSYPGRFYENECWIIKAYRILQDSGVLTETDPNGGFSERPNWKRVCACWLHRYASTLIGLKWTSHPDVMKAFDLPWHQITLADFEDDFSFSWLLSAETRKELTEIFVARMTLCITIGHLNKTLWNRTASEMRVIGQIPDCAHSPPSACAPIEEVEAHFQEWNLRNASFLSTPSQSSATKLERQLVLAEQFHTKLIYAFATACLYQNTLFLSKGPITDWSAGLVRSSRNALWGSISSIQSILREVQEEKIVTLLPLTMLIVVFVPLTVYSLHLQNSSVYDPVAIKDLAICSEIAATMGDLHDGANYYIKILNETMALAQRYRATAWHRELSSDKFEVRADRGPGQLDADSILREPRLHSLLLRFHGLALALGRIPSMETALRAFAPPLLSSQKS